MVVNPALRLGVLAGCWLLLTSCAGEPPRAAAPTIESKDARFLLENSKRPDVVTLPSGLQYRIIRYGTGYTARLTDTVKIHYRATLVSGAEFENTFTRDEPLIFKVNRFIKGLTEAMQLMRKGDHWVVYLPPDLAYGEAGAAPLVAPNSAVIFEIQMLEIW